MRVRPPAFSPSTKQSRGRCGTTLFSHRRRRESHDCPHQVAQASLIQNPTLGESSGLLFPFNTHMLPTFVIIISHVLNIIFTQPARVKLARLLELLAQIDLATQAFQLGASRLHRSITELSHIIRSQRIAAQVVAVYDRAVKAAAARQQVGLVPMPESQSRPPDLLRCRQSSYSICKRNMGGRRKK